MGSVLLGGKTEARPENTGGRVLIWNSNYPPDSSQAAKPKVLGYLGFDITNAIAVAAGDAHSLVLLANGKVVGIGNNEMGQAFAGKGQIIGWTPSTNTKALRFASTYQQQGEALVHLRTGVLTDVMKIAARVHHSIAVRKDGSVEVWGADFQAEPFLLPVRFGKVTSVACGRDADWFLMHGGSLIELRKGLAQPVLSVSNVVMVAGTTHDRSQFVVLSGNGQVCSGSVREGVKVLVNSGSDVKSIAAGGWQILTLHADGKLTAHGGYLPENLTNITAVAVGEKHSLALKADGTVVSWGINRRRQAESPTGLSNVIAIAAGNGFSLAVTTNAVVAESFRR
ncbi:MAG TPA: hypothetical protein VFZ59_14000 [Verrucomicrobiae bacterium]|nr:hypothetical protein [Verrucomicrobiae bacterium]